MALGSWAIPIGIYVVVALTDPDPNHHALSALIYFVVIGFVPAVILQVLAVVNGVRAIHASEVPGRRLAWIAILVVAVPSVVIFVAVFLGAVFVRPLG
jgi:hypothetical protein